ncbi:MAG: 23S rRNA (pseudouridine(1915)-N(3))-methyltransferase RlmH [Alphaproteobacteria bacterium]|nr:23S rRNA (pseudouridine(1915)-N(3))-methyltransferase RlmH [Alphaproteobacteria bacterium]
MKIAVLAIGKMGAAETTLCDEYLKRMKGKISVKEVASPKNLPPAQTQKAEAEKILASLPAKAYAILLDERGKDLTSREFASKLDRWKEQNADLVFIIGGADGVTEDVRKRANFTLGFGKLTWPHRLVRVMLLEQIYRAAQISAGHPYHRD